MAVVVCCALTSTVGAGSVCICLTLSCPEAGPEASVAAIAASTGVAGAVFSGVSCFVPYSSSIITAAVTAVIPNAMGHIRCHSVGAF